MERGAAALACATLLASACAVGGASETCVREGQIAADSLSRQRGYEFAAELVILKGDSAYVNEPLMKQFQVEAESLRVRTVRLCESR